MMAQYLLGSPDLCPAHLAEGLQRWKEHGIPPGDFLLAVLENSLSGALQRADAESLEMLPAIYSYVYNRMPRECHGSEERVAAWPATLALHKAALAAREEHEGHDDRAANPTCWHCNPPTPADEDL